MKRLLGLLLVTSIALKGCNDYKEIKNEDVGKAFILNSSPTFKGYFYKGSDNNYSYFVSKWDIANDRYFKIPNDRLTIVESLKFNKEDKELRVDLIENGNQKFAENEFYKLYVIQSTTTNNQSPTENQFANTLAGVWTDGSGPNASVRIEEDSIYDVEHFERTKYELTGDSLTIFYEDEAFKAKIKKLDADSLIYVSKYGETKMWRFKD
jgi:hypothetical protein